MTASSPEPASGSLAAPTAGQRSATPGIIDAAAYRDGRRVASLAIEEIPATLATTSDFVWIGLYEPDEELLRRVQGALGLHELAIEDAHGAHQRPKLERYGDSLFVALRTAHCAEAPFRLEFGETHIFVGARYVVTVRHGSLTSHVGLRARCEATPERLARGPGFVLYALVDFVVDQYFPLIDRLEEQFDTIETDVFDDVFDRETGTRIYNLRRDLLYLKRAAFPLIEVCSRLERFDGGIVAEETRVYFRDIQDHLLKIHETVDDLREMVGSVLEAHLSFLSMRQNEDMKKLAGWAAILAVPTLVAGIYGMNFRHMPELDWTLGYPLALAGMAAVCLGLYWQFKRVDWL